MVYVEGKYRAGEVCEQWRCEGEAVEVGVNGVAETAPPSSFAQMIASAAVSSEERRPELRDPSAFAATVGSVKQRLVSGQAGERELSESVVVYEVRPVRAELLIGGPDFGAWERAEWRRRVEGDTTSPWAAPRRILPY
jgi:hypothetical protein